MFHYSRFSIWIIFLLLIAACRAEPSPSQTNTPPSNSSTPLATNTPFQPSPTPLPLAASVNDEPLILSSFQKELSRYTAAMGREPSPEETRQVLDSMIDDLLLSQGAKEKGFTATNDLIRQRIDDLIKRLGSPEALQSWMATNGYSEIDFRNDLAREVEAAWMRDQIASEVSKTSEQVHLVQLLFNTQEQANESLTRLQNGANFDIIAGEVDPITGGELGWIPRGYLFYPELEEAAFQLQPGQYSSIIPTLVGFHILQVTERELQHPLSPEALLLAQKQAVQQWLMGKRSQSEIQILLP